MALRKLSAHCKGYHCCTSLSLKQGQTLHGQLAENQPIFLSRVTGVSEHSGAVLLADAEGVHRTG